MLRIHRRSGASCNPARGFDPAVEIGKNEYALQELLVAHDKRHRKVAAARTARAKGAVDRRLHFLALPVFDHRVGRPLGPNPILRRDRGRLADLGVEALEICGGPAIVSRSVGSEQERHRPGDAEESDDARMRGEKMK